MKALILVVMSITMTACQAMPALFSSVDDMVKETSSAISASIEPEALNQNTDVTITIDVKNSPQAK